MNNKNCIAYAWALAFCIFCAPDVFACPKQCIGYQGWTPVNASSCGDPAGSCLGGSYSDCAPCEYVRSFGTCVASTSGLCYEDTSGPTKRVVSYTLVDAPLPGWKAALCLAAYLITGDQMVYCVCLKDGDSCNPTGVVHSNDDTGCVSP